MRSRFRRLFSFSGKFRKSSYPLQPSDISTWAEELYRTRDSEPYLRRAIFTVEQLELHARALAAGHELSPRGGDDRLLKRLAGSERIITQCFTMISSAHTSGQRQTPAEEWLLDNHYLMEEQIHLARNHFPPSYSRRLPRLAGGESRGLPRVYDLIFEYIAHVDGRLDEEALNRYIAAYQSVTHLTMGELWSVAIMLRLALVENLRRVAVSISWQRAHRENALAWAQRIDASADQHERALLVLARMIHENPPLSTAFVAQFSQALQGRRANSIFVLAWLEQRLAEQGQTIEEVGRAESQSQAADQATLANSIISLRLVNAIEWYKFVESHSITEEILRSDPANVYGTMDFATRDEYRHVVEAMSRKYHLTEAQVARTTVAMSAARHAVQSTDVAAHVGYMLIDEGKHYLERELRGKPSANQLPRPPQRGWKLIAYLGPVTLLSTVGVMWFHLQAGQFPEHIWWILVFCASLAASHGALAVVNWFVTLFVKPRALPRLDFEWGIPDEYRTIAVVPTLLSGRKRIERIIEGLELRYLANRDPNLWFGLLTDFGDAAVEHADGDEELLSLVSDGIAALNEKYSDTSHGRFFLFHRPRLYNPQEGCWMGRERKRGKLEDFNSLLCGDDQAQFSRIVGDTSLLTSIRYVITLDTDTDLPWGAGWRLVGAAAHPLNRPKIDPVSQRLIYGYAILQPRVSISLRSAEQSPYSRLLAGEVGLDPYTRVVSDVYQDLFAESSFIGKGIYDVGAFRQLLHGRFPDNTVLSHDLIESCYARSGQISDVELFEDSPSGYLSDVSRRHRWMRGDWQIMPWLGLRVSDATGRRLYPEIAALGRWKIFDNLRRAFVAPAYTILLVLGWIFPSQSLAWTLMVLSLLFVPELLPGLAELLQRPPKYPLFLHLSTVFQSTIRRLTRIFLWLTFLPFEASVAIDATVRSLWRMFLSRKRLLEWQTAAAVENMAAVSFIRVLRRMWLGPVLTAAIAALLMVTDPLTAAAVAAPVLLLWFLSPLVAWWISRPLKPVSKLPDNNEVRFLRRIARLTWRYFEVFVNAHENWLPPDNFQEQPNHRVAHRTSPTNMGLSLLSNLTAYDLGYLSGDQLLNRTARTVESMEQMERYRGHFFNWYSTTTRKSLRPLYVSTVDSGNLIGHVRVLRSGLAELINGPLLPASLSEGLHDTLHILAGHIQDCKALASVNELMSTVPVSLYEKMLWLRELSAAASELAKTCDHLQNPEAAWWAKAFERQLRSFLTDLTEMAPWLSVPVGPLMGEIHRLVNELNQTDNLQELANLAYQAATTAALPTGVEDSGRLVEALILGAERISSRIRQLEALAERCSGLTDAEFSFLYDSKRKLMAIGYWVTERRLDNSFYDLLASEARLASYVAIASGQIPFDHWFALGRRLTMTRGRQILLSWSGSMFEYLMPLLVMPLFRGTLLDQTCNAAVARQIQYGKQQGVPWGISESGYNVRDVEGTYQYRAFGVPGLGLQRGLSDDLVVSPYASIIALLVDPLHASRNLRRMANDALLGPYGFYEAIDYTPVRTNKGEGVVVPAFMAHHQGMSLIALGQAVLGPLMHRRFLSNPDFRAAVLLLQERIPKATSLLAPHLPENQVTHHRTNSAAMSAMRVFNNPNTSPPEVHLLSNGRYHVMVSAAGAGYSRWHDIDISRWREDSTSESSGVFCFIGDVESRRIWSNSFQPTLRTGRKYEAVFTLGRAEFRRQDNQIETHTDIAVSTEDDCEIRRITMANRSETPRTLQVTAYSEIVLASGVTDELHRVFSNLFVDTEIVPDLNAVLLTRRPRSSEEQSPWVFCLMPPPSQNSSSCSFETDRARFIGRGRNIHLPAAMDDWGPLSGSMGAVLDPCMAIRRTVELDLDASSRIDLIIGVAPSREAAMALILKYQDHRMADRVFDVAPPHGRAVLGLLGVGEAEARYYGQLASAVIFPTSTFRAPSSILRRNRKSQSGLWGYAISGDLPILLLRVSDNDNLHLVRDLLSAHAFLRMQGLLTDLVIWNEDPTGYRQVLNEKILEFIAAGTEAHLLDKPGGIFVRNIDNFPEEDRVLLQAVARIVLRDSDGPLAQQLERRQRAMPSPPLSMASLPLLPPKPERSEGAEAPRKDLIFANGTGGFTRDGREYIIDLPPGKHTPAPWVNVIANPRIGTVVSERGSAYTWFNNAQLYRLTPWHNDSISDQSGEIMYIRDESSGRFFSPMPWPRPSSTPYACRHGFGYSIFEHREDGLSTELTTFVAVDAPVKFLVLKIRNLGGNTRTLSIFASIDLVLGDLRHRQAMHIVTTLDPLTGAILAHNKYNHEFCNTVCFFDCSEPRRTITGDRAEFLGRNCDSSSPAALRQKRLSGRLGPGLDPCAAMQAEVELAGGEMKEIVFIVGAGDNNAEATSLIHDHRGVSAASVVLKEVWQFWNEKLSVLHAETPDTALNVLMNGWLPYQVLSCRMWGRSGFYQSGGAFGFRDQLQDCLAIMHQMPGLTRQHLLRSARQQFVEGDVQHWWHPPGGRGVRTRCSDDYLWLPYAVARYVNFTGDTGVLEEQVPFLTGRDLNDREESYYDLPGRADQSETLYEHCTRAILNGMRRGRHNLPLMGSGDWNDGMNRVGHLGQGESVWLAFFQHEVLSKFAAVAAQRGDDTFARQCVKTASELSEHIEKNAWDGQWYRRAYFDNGDPLGSAQNDECRIDSLPQSWATIAGVGESEHRRMSLDSLWDMLVRQDVGIVQLFTPPFDHSSLEPGYIKGYPPGVRENGGQYTHAAVWAALAFSLAGRGEQAESLITLLNPINHTLDPNAVERYKVEPYVIAADIYSQPPYTGRGGWTWYTGSAAWLYRLLHEVILGIEREADTITFRPRVPASWTRFTVHYRYFQTHYHIGFTLEATHEGPVRLTLDGQTVPDGTLKLVNDQREHIVEVLFGSYVIEKDQRDFEQSSIVGDAQLKETSTMILRQN